MVTWLARRTSSLLSMPLLSIDWSVMIGRSAPEEGRRKEGRKEEGKNQGRKKRGGGKGRRQDGRMNDRKQQVLV